MGEGIRHPGGGQQEGKRDTERYHTPDDPKGSADWVQARRIRNEHLMKPDLPDLKHDF